MDQHCVWCLMGGLGMVGQRPIGSHGFIHENENMCRVTANRDRYPVGCVTPQNRGVR